MTKIRARKLDRALAWWVDTVRRSARWVVIFATILTIAILYYTVNNLGISTDTADMLSESLHFRRILKDYVEAFPQYNNTLLIVIDGDTPDLAHDAASALANRLRNETGLFKSVYLPGGGRFFEKHGLLYLSPSELDDLTDSLAKVQPFLAGLSSDQSLRGIFSMLRNAVEAGMNKADLDLSSLFDRLSAAIEAALNQRRYEISWLELMRGEGSKPDERRRLIIVQPRLDPTSLLPGKTPIKAVRNIAQKLHLKRDQGIRVRITGSVALEYEELISVSRGAMIAGLLALILVGIVLFAGLGSPRLVLATLVTLIMGLIWTAGFATVAVGHLNLISVAFAVLFIGLGVDYAIHFCLRYKELIKDGNSHSTALQGTARNIGGSLVMCSFTTAIGFYAFIPTIFAGIAELGVISGTGMFIGLIANLTVLPALLTLAPLSRKAVNGKKRSGRLAALLFTLPLRHFVAIRIGALALGLGSLFLLPHATFDRNTLNLRDPESESVSTFTELLSQSRNAPWSLKILSPDLDAAREYADRLNELDLVYRAITLKDFVPTKQDIKLAGLEEISLILGPDLIEKNPQPPPSTPEQVASLQNFLSSLETFLEKKGDSPLVSQARDLRDILRRYNAAVLSLEEPLKSKMLKKLEKSIIASLPERLRTLRASLSAGSVIMKDLPEDLRERWVADDGRYLIEVFPRDNLNDNEALHRFVAAVQKIAPDAIGLPVIIIEAGSAVIQAFQQAFLFALIAIIAVLLILLRRKSDTLLVILPLFLAGALTGAASVLLDIPFNFANVIALPLILGVGVDNGIHMVHRMRSLAPMKGHVLQTSTARAVFFSSLTTICSFGNLALSPHRGMASMGQLLSIGIGVTLLCTLIVLPALIKKGNDRLTD